MWNTGIIPKVTNISALCTFILLFLSQKKSVDSNCKMQNSIVFWYQTHCLRKQPLMITHQNKFNILFNIFNILFNFQSTKKGNSSHAKITCNFFICSIIHKAYLHTVGCSTKTGQYNSKSLLYKSSQPTE